MRPGLFVTFEGGEGTGKSTQMERLVARLERRGIVPLQTREPGGTPLAERIRALLLEPADARPDEAERRDAFLDATRAGAAAHRARPGAPPGAVTELLLMEAARADLVEHFLRPALAAGRVVLCDRYDDSTLAYQGGGRGLDDDVITSLNRLATGGLRPDVTLLFDLDPSVGQQRLGAARADLNRLDREPLEFHRRVRERYLRMAAAEPGRFAVVDAALPPDTLEERVWAVVEPRLSPGIR